MSATLFGRRCRVTVDGFAVEGLRIGFTVDKTRKREPNTAEIAVYNLASGTRERLHRKEGVPVVIEAGYEDTGLVLIFAGEMREAFSRPERDGSWVTILRAGDGDKAKKKRKSRGLRPGVSIERVISDMTKDLGVGIGNVSKELLSGNFSAEGLGKAFASGFTSAGQVAAQFDKLAESTGHEWSIQDGEVQLIKAGKALAVTATVLTPSTGLEGTPEIDEKGVMTCRARIVPGLLPGYTVEVESSTVGSVAEFTKTLKPAGIWAIDRVRYVGDTHGVDWNAELTCREITA